MNADESRATGSYDSGFGGLCFNGHDVPRGANYCPECGAPTPNSARDRAWPHEPPPYQPHESPPYQPHESPPYQQSQQEPVRPRPPFMPWGYDPSRPPFGRPWGYGPGRSPAGAPAWGPAAWMSWASGNRRALNPLGPVSLALALSVFVTSWWGAVAAVLTGHAARYLARRYDQRGRIYAGFGLAMGYFFLFTFALLHVT